MYPGASHGFIDSKMPNRDVPEFGFHTALSEAKCLHDVVL